MAISDYVAILLGHSLDVAKLNKKKTRSDFYAQVALPPAAVGALADLVAAVYPGVPLGTLEVNLATNAQQAKPFVGVPADWYILRMASQYAPELYAADGTTPIATANARAHFFAGMKVRIHTSAWGWKNEFGKQGASFNLHGLMDAGIGGERLSIGSAGAGAVFATHANPNAQASMQSVAATAAETPAGNPFAAQQTQVAQPAATTASANPFVQTTAAAVNPFAAQ